MGTGIGCWATVIVGTSQCFAVDRNRLACLRFNLEKPGDRKRYSFCNLALATPV